VSKLISSLQFGVFQSYYVSDQLPTNTATEIAWIGSVQLCLCPLLGCFSGPLFDSGYLRHLIITGGTLYVFSMMMASISKVYWQYLLSHGIGVGLGMGIMFSPSVSTISHHFALTTYRSMAYGIQATGSCFGGILFPILARNLFSTVGFDWTVRICECLYTL
jgi:MFS family permease